MPAIETVLKRFETPDEVRTFEKRKIRTGSYWRHDDWTRHLSARMEVVASRRPQRWCVALQRGTCGAGAFGLRDGSDGGRDDPRAACWHAIFHSTRTTGAR